MSVYRVHKTGNYTVMSNHHLNNKALSLSAKGLLSVMLSLPNDWNYSIRGLASISKEGDKAIKSALDELRDNGYIVVTRMNPAKGRSRITYLYDVYEEPVEVEIPRKPQFGQAYPSEGVVAEGVLTETLLAGGQVSTKETSTKDKDKSRARETRNDDSNYDISHETDLPVASGFEPPTLEEVKAFCEANMQTRCDPELFFATYAAQGWLMGNGLPMTNWQAAVKKWHSNDLNKAMASKMRGVRDSRNYSAEFAESTFRKLGE